MGMRNAYLIMKIPKNVSLGKIVKEIDVCIIMLLRNIAMRLRMKKKRNMRMKKMIAISSLHEFTADVL